MSMLAAAQVTGPHLIPVIRPTGPTRDRRPRR